jgi:hypothetical protein
MSSLNRSSAMIRLPAVVAASGFAIAAPLFDLLGSHAEFFVAHGTRPTELVMLSLGLVAIPPALLWLVLRLAFAIAPHAATVASHMLVGLLFSLTALPPLLRMESVNDAPSLAIAAGVGAGVALAHACIPVFRSLLAFLGVAPIVLAALFLFGSDARKIMWTAEPSIQPALTGTSDIPVVFIIFDELPLSSLQDASGRIDESLYPAFAALASDGLFFTGISSVSIHTEVAVPAILSGRYPGTQAKLPLLAEYPETLFTLLGGTHRANVVETMTMLSTNNPGPRDTRPWASLMADLGLVYLHIILPDTLRIQLPAIDTHWGRFFDTSIEPSRQSQTDARKAAKDFAVENRLASFESFAEGLRQAEGGEPAHSRPALHFLHILVPHGPWRHLPSGATYEPYQPFGMFITREWPAHPWWSIDAWRRHLLQVGFADQLLGELIESLRSIGLYDRALIVVTADHGVTFQAGHHYRKPNGGGELEDILSVPLIMRAPGLPQGQVMDRVGETIDILPTMTDILDVELPWPIDGCSLLDQSCTSRTSRRLYVRRTPSELSLERYSTDVVGHGSTLRRKVELFGEEEEGLYVAGQALPLIGRRASRLVNSSKPAGRIVVNAALRKVYNGERPHVVPARFVGRVFLEEPHGIVPSIALAVDDEIQVVVPAPSNLAGKRLVVAMLPEAVIDRLPGSLSAYLIEGAPESARLRPLQIE